MNSPDDEWFKDIIHPQDVESIVANTERLEEDMETFYEMTFFLSREEAIRTCQQVQKVAEGDDSALMHVLSIMYGITSSLEYALSTDGIDPYEE